MTRIADLLGASRGPSLSVEFFPPKTEAGEDQFSRAIDELSAVDLTFVSVTYGAGGSTRDRTRDLVVNLNNIEPYPAMAHLTCIGHTRAELESLLDDYDRHGVHNILALAGDPPMDGSPARGDFSHAYELVELIRSRGDHFSIGVAAHPEFHPRSANRAQDRTYLAEKLRAADFGLTQFFFDPSRYFEMMDDLDRLGCTTPVIPGIMPLTNPAGVRRMAEMSGATFPKELAQRVGSTVDDDRRRIIVEAAAELSQRLLDGGAPGLHIYALNRSEIVLSLVEELGLRIKAPRH